jgi:hypothetical protein
MYLASFRQGTMMEILSKDLFLQQIAAAASRGDAGQHAVNESGNLFLYGWDCDGV